jgi:hypothetical protein
MSLQSIPGIGPMAAGRLNNEGIATKEELIQYIQTLPMGELEPFVYRISRNLKRGCHEGYYPRIHNKMIYDGLADIIMETRGIRLRDAHRTRAPPTQATRPQIYCGSSLSNNDPYSRATMEREGVAFRGVPGPQTEYRYGKSCKPGGHLDAAERNRLIREDIRYQTRRYYPCECFREEATCNDFRVENNNRIIGRSGKPTRSYCIYNQGQCISDNAAV